MKQQSTSNSENIEVQQILKYLNILASISFTDTQKIRKAQQQLSKLSFKSQFIHALLSIPLQPNISHEIGKIAITYTKSYAKTLINQHRNSDLVQCAQAIIQKLSISTLNFKLKEELVESLVLILQKQGNKNLLLSSQQQLVKLLTSALYQQNVQNINFQFLALLSYAILKAIPLPFFNHIQFLQGAFSDIIKITLILSKLLTLMNIDTSKSMQIQKQNEQNIEKALILMCKYLQIIKKWIRRLKMANNKLSHIIDNNNLNELITNNLNFNLPNNSQPYSIFYARNTQQPNYFNSKILSSFHEIKAKTISVLTLCTGILLSSSINNPYQHTTLKYQLTNRFKLIKQGQQLTKGLIASVKNLLSTRQYYQLQSRWQVQIIQQIYQYLIIIINSNIFYSIILQNKFNIIYGIVFKTLLFTEQDYQNFVQEPEQFISCISQIFRAEEEVLFECNKTKKQPNRNKSASYKVTVNRQNKNSMDMQQGIQQNVQLQKMDEEQLQIFQNIKTISSKLLLTYIQNIDGTLAELVIFCLNILNSLTVQTTYKKDIVLLILAIVRNCVSNHDSLKFKIGQVLISMIRIRIIPNKFIKQQNNSYSDNWQSVEYSMIFINLDRYIELVYDFIDQLCQTLLILIGEMITNPQVQEINKLIASHMLPKILITEQGSVNSDKVVQVLMTTLQPNIINLKYLQCLEMIISENGSELQGQFRLVRCLVSNVVALMCMYIKNQGMQGIHQQANRSTIIYKLWHIIQEISINKYLMPNITPILYESLTEVLKLINVQDSSNELILQEQLFKTIIIIVKSLQNVSEFELQVLELCRCKFYNGSEESKYSLTIMYDVIQNIIYYGVNALNTQENFFRVKQLLEMAIYSISQQSVGNLPRSEAQCCEGVFLMQSLIIAYGKMFDKTLWNVIMQCLRSKIKVGKVSYDFLKAALLSNMALTVVFAYNYFENSQLCQVLKEILAGNYCFTYKDSGKIYTVALIQMLPLTQVQFIKQQYPKLLQTVLSMLQVIYHKKDTTLQGQDLDNEEKQYYKIKQQTKNTLNRIDQFDLFRNQIQKIKVQNKQLFQFLFSTLSESKKIYMKQILSVRKVNNSARVIYKIKPKT